ncbi:MAG: peptide chain release factor-like protein [Chloroflexi bacterium]|nr:peptide chain release factor-like protein [Chloroflexota bacterium]
MKTTSNANGSDIVKRHFTTDVEALRKEVIIEPYRAAGPGGQRKNRKETAIRLTHVPSGITVVASERRSQAMNREVAFERLLKKLSELNRPRKRRVQTRPSASAIRAKEEEKEKRSRKKELRGKIDSSGELN